MFWQIPSAARGRGVQPENIRARCAAWLSPMAEIHIVQQSLKKSKAGRTGRAALCFERGFSALPGEIMTRGEVLLSERCRDEEHGLNQRYFAAGW
jgi:hypothetical protein